jgi:outer membrane protein assembly factor BamB
MRLTRPAHWPRWLRYAVSVLVVLTVLGATAVVGYRVLAPADTADAARADYPDRPTAQPTRYGELIGAPLIVDGRLRVFADARRVWSDAPVTAKTEMTPFWTFRRWPAEVAGLVAVEGKYEGVALVIVKFSDGMLVALNPRNGRIAWQDQTKTSEQDRFDGRRTGAATVYEPAGLFTARSSKDGSAVLISAGADEVVSYDPWTGRRRWEHTFTENPGCHDIDWTGETTYVAKDSCAAPAELQIFDAESGLVLGRWRPPGASAGPADEANWFVEPVSCVRGHSGCALIRAAGVAEVVSTAPSPLRPRSGAAAAPEPAKGVKATIWRLNHDGTIAAEQFATADRPYLQGESLIQLDPTTVDSAGNATIESVARATGRVQWHSKEPVRWLVQVDLSGVYAITEDLELVVLHPATGVDLSHIDLRKRAGERWVPGFVSVAGRFVAVERTTGGDPSESDDRYYVGSTPVVLAGV